MQPEENIKKIEEDLYQLQRQLQQQQQKINELQSQLSHFTVSKNSEDTSIQKNKNQKHLTIENFIGLRLIHFIGIVVLVIGLSIGVKYAIDQNLVSEKLRIALSYVSAAILFFLSLTLKKNYSLFSAILFSGSMASFYFTTYAAFVYYQMFSAPMAFITMVLLTLITSIQAINYNHQEIALLGLVGAYAIPFLISKNADKPELFFSYIFLINVAVSYLVIRKNWKLVLCVANLITWILFIAWAALHYNSELQFLSFVFMSLFFILFMTTIIFQKGLNNISISSNDVYFILLNNIALYFASLYVFGSGFGKSDVAIITFLLFILAILETVLIYFKWRNQRAIINMMMNYAIIMLILFIAFEWSGFTVTFMWLLTSVILFIWGVSMKYVQMRMAAIILMGITLIKLVVVDSISFTTIEKIISYLVLGILLLVISFFYQKFKHQLFDTDNKKLDK